MSIKPGNKKSYMWWEKTVEYKFVIEASQQGLDFASPFDGSHEKAGDAMFVKGSKIVLIEFKRYPRIDDDEKKKYSNFELARKELKDRDEHHFLIGGVGVSEKTGGTVVLNLSAKRYFSGENICITSGKVITSVADVLDCGAEKDEFNSYLEVLLKYKSKPSRDDKGGVASASDYSYVMGLLPGEKKVCAAMTFSRYIEVEGLIEHEINGEDETDYFAPRPRAKP